MVEKLCATCAEVKPIEEFHRNKERRDGRVFECKPCVRRRHEEHGYPEKMRAAALARYYANHDENKRKAILYQKKRAYGLTAERYVAMLAAQNGRCFLCNKEAKLMVDHCHATKTVRRLLCRNCNSGIGLLGEDVALIQRAIDYINGSWRDAGP